MIIHGGGAGAAAEVLPLYSLRDSAYTFRNSQSTVEPLANSAAPVGGGTALIAGLFNTQTGSGFAKRQFSDGSMRYVGSRDLATSGMAVTNLNIPGNASWADYPSAMRPARRYVFEYLTQRSLPLTPSNVFEHGLQRNNSGTGNVLPSTAFNYGKFAFRCVDTENGGNWSVINRPVDGGAAVITPTSFSPDVLRTFKIELLQNSAGAPGSLAMSIDNQVVGLFAGAPYFPPPAQPFPVGTHDTIYNFSFGNQGAAGGSIFVDYDVLAEWRLDVYAI